MKRVTVFLLWASKGNAAKLVDKSIPPTEAVRLLNAIKNHMSETQVVMTAGRGFAVCGLCEEPLTLKWQSIWKDCALQPGDDLSMIEMGEEVISTSASVQSFQEQTAFLARLSKDRGK